MPASLEHRKRMLAHLEGTAMKLPTAVQMTLSLPAELHRQIVTAAAADRPVSLNFEIVRRLYASFDQPASIVQPSVVSQAESA